MVISVRDLVISASVLYRQRQALANIKIVKFLLNIFVHWGCNLAQWVKNYGLFVC